MPGDVNNLSFMVEGETYLVLVDETTEVVLNGKALQSDLLRELTQWLQALDPHRSVTGEHDSRYCCAGDPTWKQAALVAQGDNVVFARQPSMTGCTKTGRTKTKPVAGGLRNGSQRFSYRAYTVLISWRCMFKGTLRVAGTRIEMLQLDEFRQGVMLAENDEVSCH